MGYACPVCDVEQADAVHLANHLAVTASLGREDHLEWLEDHAPEWESSTPAELAAIVGEYALEVDVPEFADDSNTHQHGHRSSDGRAPTLEDELARQARHRGRDRVQGRGTLTAETEAVLDEARELTAQMRHSIHDNETSGEQRDFEESDVETQGRPGTENENA